LSDGRRVVFAVPSPAGSRCRRRCPALIRVVGKLYRSIASRFASEIQSRLGGVGTSDRWTQWRRTHFRRFEASTFQAAPGRWQNSGTRARICRDGDRLFRSVRARARWVGETRAIVGRTMAVTRSLICCRRSEEARIWGKTIGGETELGEGPKWGRPYEK